MCGRRSTNNSVVKVNSWPACRDVERMAIYAVAAGIGPAHSVAQANARLPVAGASATVVRLSVSAKTNRASGCVDAGLVSSRCRGVGGGRGLQRRVRRVGARPPCGDVERVALATVASLARTAHAIAEAGTRLPIVIWPDPETTVVRLAVSAQAHRTPGSVDEDSCCHQSGRRRRLRGGVLHCVRNICTGPARGDV